MDPKEIQYSVNYPYYEFVHCTKLLYWSKKWWYFRPLNSEGTSNNIYVHWANHFKVLYDKKKINHGTLKMEYNRPHDLYSLHILKYGGCVSPYFDYEENIFSLYWIKLVNITKKTDNAVELNKINKYNKAIKGSG